MSTVIPFRRPKKKEPAPPEDPSCCPSCGWKFPTNVRATGNSVDRGEKIFFNITCPECKSELLWVIGFEPS